MKYKASLHIHAFEDRNEKYDIKYNVYQLIDKAKKFNFKILAFTFHDKMFFNKKCFNYAKEKGILLIPGIEKSVFDKNKKRTHVVILNAKKEIEKINTWEELKEYKKKNSDIFVLLAHPFFPFINIKENTLKQNIDIFDGIEHSWAYSRLINFNKKAKRLAKKYNKPFIATSDLHNLRYFNNDYTEIETSELKIKDVLDSLKIGKNKNFSNTKNIFSIFYTIIRSRF
ncbi:PHP domain-containing protein [bacterium]|nr:PHP domain-containing protein [bacterium]